MARARRKSATHDPDYVALVARVREAREEAGLTQLAVGQALGRPASFVSKIELRERRLDPIDLMRFAELYKKPLEYFYPTKPRSRPNTR